MLPYAEVIGDPVAHSRSATIHGFWLETLSIRAGYRATRVGREELADFLRGRRADPLWRGCNVTAPLKEAILPLLDGLDPEAISVGAVNCVRREGARLIGSNTDLDGIAEALGGVDLAGARVAVIGGGGAARAMVHHAVDQRCAAVALLLRDPARGAALTGLATTATRVECVPHEQWMPAIAGAALLVNATPLGMTGGRPMPLALLDAAASVPAAFDMVYAPVETPFLTAAGQGGARTIDGLVMLIGQARRAFHIFFDAKPPVDADAGLRVRLSGPVRV